MGTPADQTGAKTAAAEAGWLPDCVYTEGKFESGLAFFADDLGRITRFSREPADLAAARRMPGQAALPGLVNGHSQAFQRALRGHPDRRGASRPDTVVIEPTNPTGNGGPKTVRTCRSHHRALPVFKRSEVPCAAS